MMQGVATFYNEQYGSVSSDGTADVVDVVYVNM